MRHISATDLSLWRERKKPIASQLCIGAGQHVINYRKINYGGFKIASVKEKLVGSMIIARTNQHHHDLYIICDIVNCFVVGFHISANSYIIWIWKNARKNWVRTETVHSKLLLELNSIYRAGQTFPLRVRPCKSIFISFPFPLFPFSVARVERERPR